ncbi:MULTISPECIES: cytochrome P450 [unclassified Streptomyces]|uniref:cytochrome P450 n=1 Tax=Streptomyces sp. NPDC055082 TaxID=3365718 RepID=UPI0037D8B3CF
MIHWARRRRPVCPVELPDGSRLWMVSRRDDILRIFTDPDLVRLGVAAEALPSPAGIGGTTRSRAGQPGAECGATRAVESHRAAIVKQTGLVLDAMETGNNPADLLEQLAAPLTAAVCRDIFGLSLDPQELRNLLIQEEPSGNSAIRHPVPHSFTEHLRDVPARSDAGDAPLKAREQREADTEPSHTIATGLLVRCARSLFSALLTGPFTLLLHPKPLRECLRDPVLWRAAARELRRYHPGTVLGPAHVALRDLELHGTLIKAGDAICASPLGAAWDEEHHPTPAKFDIHRPDVRSADFRPGLGPVADSDLDRLVLTIVCPALFERFPQLRLAVDEHEIPWRSDLTFIRPACLPVAW